MILHHHRNGKSDEEDDDDDGNCKHRKSDTCLRLFRHRHRSHQCAVYWTVVVCTGLLRVLCCFAFCLLILFPLHSFAKPNIARRFDYSHTPTHTDRAHSQRRANAYAAHKNPEFEERRLRLRISMKLCISIFWGGFAETRSRKLILVFVFGAKTDTDVWHKIQTFSTFSHFLINLRWCEYGCMSKFSHEWKLIGERERENARIVFSSLSVIFYSFFCTSCCVTYHVHSPFGEVVCDGSFAFTISIYEGCRCVIVSLLGHKQQRQRQRKIEIDKKFISTFS